MYGKVICLAGTTDEGKTTYIKKFSSKLKTKNTVCYLRISDDWNDPSIKTFTNFRKFIEYANTQKDTLFIIDEAFTCLPEKLVINPDKPNKIDNLISDFLVNARKLNNFVFIIFHAVAQIPSKWVVPYLDYLVRFATNDLWQYQIARFKSFPNIVKSFTDFPNVKRFEPIVLSLRKKRN
jgi:hypothetical protein